MEERRLQMMLSSANGGACPECHISQGVNIITKNTAPTYPYSPAGERRYWMDQLVPDQYVLDFGDTYINTSTTCSITFNGNIIFGMSLDGSYYSDLIQTDIIEEYPEFSNKDLPRKIYFDMEGTEPMSTIFTRGGKKYPNIKRKRYTCISESCVLEHEREHYEKIYSSVQKREVHLLGVEEEVEFKNKWKAGKASYVERNQAMINDSDLCVFYYDENYKPQECKYTKRCFTTYQPKSGTVLAYNYAKQKKKEIINVFEILK